MIQKLIKVKNKRLFLNFLRKSDLCSKMTHLKSSIYRLGMLYILFDRPLNDELKYIYINTNKPLFKGATHLYKFLSRLMRRYTLASKFFFFLSQVCIDRVKGENTRVKEARTLGSKRREH